MLSRAAAGMLAAALCFQPMTALAGPAGDSSLTSSSSNAGPGGGSVSSNSGSTGSSGGSTSVSNGGVSAVTSGLGVYRVTENEGIGAIARGVMCLTGSRCKLEPGGIGYVSCDAGNPVPR